MSAELQELLKERPALALALALTEWAALGALVGGFICSILGLRRIYRNRWPAAAGLAVSGALIGLVVLGAVARVGG